MNTQNLINNGTITLTDNRTLTVSQFTKEISIYLIERLKAFNDAFSIGLSNSLQNTLGKDWSVVINGIDEISADKENALYNKYDLEFNAMFSELIYPAINEA